MKDVSPVIRVRVLFFGHLRELVGLGEEASDVAENSTISELFESYERRHPKLREFRRSVVASRNQEFAPWDSPLAPGDEIAFLPPVSGG
jgi:molybdopterin converting factor subunit 1